MRKTNRLLVILGAAVPLLAAAVTSEAPKPAPTNAAPPAATGSNGVIVTPIVAKGKHVTVTRKDLDEELIRIKASLAGQGRSLPGDSAMVERQILDSLVGRQLLLTKVTDADKARGKEQFDTSLQKFKTSAKITDEEFNQKLNQQILLQNITKQQWEEQGIEQATLPIMLERELKVSVSADQVLKFFDDNPGKFEQPERVRAAHILLMTTDPATRKDVSDEQKAARKKQLEDILKRARAGEDFGKLAKEFSEDPGSKDKGGEYTFPKGQMVPEFEAAAFSLNTNQISDIVTTAYGYHIIKLYEKLPAKKMEFDKVAPDIKDYLMQREVQKLVPDFLQKLRKDAGVEILDEKLKAVELPTPAAADSPSGAEK
jgi:peptidyl-prolyl cis-trans isomerase C